MDEKEKELSRRSFLGRAAASLVGAGLGLTGAKKLGAAVPGSH